MEQDLQMQSTANALTLQDVAEDVRAEMEQDIRDGMFDLPSVRMLKEGEAFEIPGGEITKTFRGFVLCGKPSFVCWESAQTNDEEGSAPSCISVDGIKGSAESKIINAGGEDRTIFGYCNGCWYNKFKSGIDNQGNLTAGKRCKNKRKILIWPVGHDTLFPWLMIVPTMSINHGRGVTFAEQSIGAEGMARFMSPVHNTIAEFSVIEKKSKGGITYPVLQAKAVGGLENGKGIVTAEMRQQMESLRQQFGPILGVEVMNVAEPEDVSDTAPSIQQPGPVDGEDIFEETKKEAGY